MASMQRDMSDAHVTANHDPERADSPVDSTLNFESLDAVVVGAGFAGCYLLYKLRKQNFKAKIIEAGADLGGIWHWNKYPGARVDSQYPIYAYSIPEVYNDWNWSSHYPGGEELRAYFQHVDRKLGIKKDTVFNSKVTKTHFNEDDDTWTIHCNTGKIFRAHWFIASLGFAAKRYFPDWEGLESFKGTIHHSSFWPGEGVSVRGKKCGVIGTGATGIQITQEWAREIGEEGSLKMMQRTPNLACPMRQIFMTPEEQTKDKLTYPELFDQRWKNYTGFLYQVRPELMFDHTPEQRRETFDLLWNLGGFRFLMNNYFDMNRDLKANREAYNYWRDHVRERIRDPRKAELLAPTEPPHPFGAKRLSLEQDFYDQFDRPNIDVIDIKTNPIMRIEPNGIRQQDGTFHELDVIALATGFDSITGGLKDIEIKGLNGELLADKWKEGTWTYLGMMTSRFPNFLFTYGPQAPTAFSNGPTCVELQGDWIVELCDKMRESGKTRIDPKLEKELGWKESVNESNSKVVRGHTPSWYNGANIPGKPRESLNFAGGIPVYIQNLRVESNEGYPGFNVK